LEVESATYNPLVGKFEAFLRDEYFSQIQKLAERYPEEKSLEIDYKKLDKFNIDLADELLENPNTVIDAIKKAVQGIDSGSETTDFEPHVRFINIPREEKHLITNINASHLNKLIAVEGVVRLMVDVLPKLKLAAFRCKKCGRVYRIPQNDLELTRPGFCECDRREFELMLEESTFIDFQKIQIQEPLEYMKGGEQAKYIEVLLEDDLTNKLTPGARIEVIGTLRLRPPVKKTSVYGRYLEANNFIQTQKEFEEVDITPKEEKQIIELAKDPEIYDKLMKSIAPGIYGNERIKESLVLQLFSGTPHKIQPDGKKIRSDIHILLIGDPGVGKSELMGYVHRLAPKSIVVSGKSSSAAGLTASAEKDEFGEGGWTLKAGALVLANGGQAMIDEFDKMTEEDRSSMHEAMEQQTVSIAKAGIVAQFKTQTSVLASANPKYGRFDPNELATTQFDVPPPLLSRFDLIFVIRDETKADQDRKIANHILKGNYAAGLIARQSQNKEIVLSDLEKAEEIIKPVIEIDLMRKYIAYARREMIPVIKPKMMDRIANFYMELRSHGRKEGVVSATARQLQAIIRLSEASAKIRLSSEIEEQDIEKAIDIFRYSLEMVAKDPETGRLDIGIIGTGKTQSSVNKMKQIMKIIAELSAEKDLIHKDDIVKHAKDHDIDEDKALEIISAMIKKGELYEPKRKYVKMIKKIE